MCMVDFHVSYQLNWQEKQKKKKKHYGLGPIVSAVAWDKKCVLHAKQQMKSEWFGIGPIINE